MHSGDHTSVATTDQVEDQFVDTNGLTIAFQTFGDPSDPALLLVMGLGGQMIAWEDQMCHDLAESGFYVVRYDNRDVGLSTHFQAEPPSLFDMVRRRGNVYTISDMARDGLGLLDELGIGRAHVVGQSMGGFIAQTMAIDAPMRLDTLTLIMTSTGSRKVGKPSPKVVANFARKPTSTTRDEVLLDSVVGSELVGSPGLIDIAAVTELAGREFDRCYDPAGVQRQLAAIMAQPDRTPALRHLRMPTTVIHGLADPLVAPSGGLALARAIPGARFIGLHGLGHDLPHTAVPTIEREISLLAQR